MKPALQAWKTRRMNDRLGLVGNSRITTQKINHYIATHNPNDRVRTFALNLHLDEKQLAKKTDTDLTSTKRFVSWVAESIVKNRKCIGKTLTIPSLQRIWKRNNPTKLKGKFVSDGKQIIHDRIIELLLDEKSPKCGVVATLAYMFSLEKKLIAIRKLQNLQFHSYEYPYDKKAKITKYNKVYRKQIRLLMRNKKLGGRCFALYTNINDMLHHETEDRFSHLFLDYCGSITTNRDTLEMVMENNLVKMGGIIWVTLCSRSCKGDRVTQQLPELSERFSDRYRIETIQNKKLFHYQSCIDKRKKRGKTMFTMLFRRIK
jgi:hypothetical protein